MIPAEATATARSDVSVFEALRPELLALAYRLLGDFERARDAVQEAWLRWSHRDAEVRSPKAYLVAIVTRVCLNELDSARARREESRSDRLPEPVDLAGAGIDRVEMLELVSMAFLVVLERLMPAERAALLLHDVFQFSHEEIGAIISRSAPTTRKLLERARKKVSGGRRLFSASAEEHRRLLDGFLRAASLGDVAALTELLAADAVLTTDGGPAGRIVGRIRNLRKPLHGAAGVAAFVAATSRSVELEVVVRELNARPALVFFRTGQPFAALLLAVADGKIQQLYFHADVNRLSHVGPCEPTAAGARSGAEQGRGISPTRA